MGPWSKKLLEVLGGEESDLVVEDLRVEPGLITARVDGETVTLAAERISAGVWAALEPIDGRLQSEGLRQRLEHTWEAPLVPDAIVRVGSRRAVAAVASALVEAIEDDPSVLLRWRGYGQRSESDDEWRGQDLPQLAPAGRRPPESVPQRFGASAVRIGDDDLVEVLVRAYRSF